MCKQKVRRAGALRKKISFLNINGRDNFNIKLADKRDIEDLSKSCVLFMCETWLRKETYTQYDSTRDCFESYASWGGIGRPSGGLEMVCANGLGAKLISKNQFHIAIKFSDTVVIGCYYTPPHEKTYPQ